MFMAVMKRGRGLFGSAANVNTTSGINHFAVSYTNHGRIAIYLNGTKIFYTPYNTAIPINIDLFVLKSPNVMEAAFYVNANAGNIYYASTAISNIVPNAMPLQPIEENYLLTEEEVAKMREIATKAAVKFVKQKYGI